MILAAPKAWAFQKPKRAASYLAMLLVVLNSKWVVNLACWPIGVMRTAPASVPANPYALSVYIVHTS